MMLHAAFRTGRAGACLAGVFALLLPASAAAQAVTATLVGAVTDTSGAAVPGATIVATQVGTDGSRTMVTGERGDYTLANLQPGVYRVSAELVGFKRAVADAVALSVNQTARLDFTLEVGTVEDTVEVAASVPVIASETSALGQVIDSQQMRDLPVKARSFYELALLAPGVTPRMPGSFVAGNHPTPGGLNAPAFYVAGAREKSNGYIIDGIDAQDPHFQTPSFFPSIDAIQEFKLQTSAYSAEFGRYASQVNVTTRAGSNDWHGAGFWFHRSDSMDARSLAQRLSGAAKAPHDYHQMGGTLGGPLMLGPLYSGRSRTFFFTSVEATRLDRGRTLLASVPTAEQRAGVFTALGFRSNRPIYDPATTRPNPNGAGFVRDPFPDNTIPASRITPFARAILERYPLPTSDAASGNNYSASIVDRSDNNQVIVRLDHRLSDRTNLSGRYAFFDGIETQTEALAMSGTSNDVRTHNAVVSLTRVFGATSLLELRGGVNNPSYLTLQDGAFGNNLSADLGLGNLLSDPIGYGVPRVSMTGFATLGSDTNPTTQESRVWHVVGHWSTVRGRHSMKAGADLRQTDYNDRSERYVRGALTFSGVMTADPQRPTATGVPVADLLLGLPIGAGGSSTSLAINAAATSVGLFVQDDWQVRDDLTLNLGVRYELNGRYTDAQNRLTYFDPDFPGGRILLSGEETAYIPGQGLVPGPASSRTLIPVDRNNVAPRVGFAWRPFGNGRTAVHAGYGLFYDATELQDLRTWVRNPPFGQVLEISGDANANSNSTAALRVGDLYPSAGTPAARPSVYSATLPLPDPYYGQWNASIQRELPGANAIEVGYMGSRGYNLAKRVNLNQAVRDADPSQPTPLLGRRPYPLYGNTIRVTEPSGASVYHGGFARLQRRFSKGYSYLVTYTFAKSIDNASLIDDGARDLANRALDRGRSRFDIRHRAVMSASWDLPFGAGRSHLSNGVPAHLLGGWQVNGVFSVRSGFPFTVSANGDICNCGAAGQTAQQIGEPFDDASGTRERWFNTAAFVNPAPGTLGNAGRNILDGPGAAVFDLSLFRQFAITGRARLQLRAEIFNLFNRDNLSQPGSTVGTATFGVIQSADDPRSAQVAVKLVF